MLKCKINTDIRDCDREGWCSECPESSESPRTVGSAKRLGKEYGKKKWECKECGSQYSDLEKGAGIKCWQGHMLTRIEA